MNVGHLIVVISSTAIPFTVKKGTEIMYHKFLWGKLQGLISSSAKGQVVFC